METLPRIRPRRFIDLKTQMKSEKAANILRQWNIEVSNFREFARDTEEVFEKCFEFDWAYTRLPKWIK